MGTDVKIGLMVGLALLVVVILYFGAKSDDQAELAQPDKPAVTTRPATAVKQVAIKPEGETGKPRIIKTATEEGKPAADAVAESDAKPVVAQSPVPVIAQTAAPTEAKSFPTKSATAEPVVSPVPSRTGQPTPAPSRTRKPIEAIVTTPSHAVRQTKASIYTVKEGDAGFWGVAEQVYGNGKYMGLIAAANPKANSTKLRAGQKLIIPPLQGTKVATPATPKAPDGYEVYTVKKGDRGFWGIAKKVYGRGRDWTHIARANLGMDSSALQPGQKLLIPPLPKGKTPRRPTPTESTPEVAAAGDTYTIEAGDDRGFWGVAEKAYGDGKYMYLITAANQGVDPDKLQVGQKLVLPPLAEARKAESRLPRLQRPKSVAAGGDGRPLFD